MNFGHTNNPRIAKISDSFQQNFWYLRRYLAERTGDLQEKKYTEEDWRILEESSKRPGWNLCMSRRRSSAWSLEILGVLA